MNRYLKMMQDGMANRVAMSAEGEGGAGGGDEGSAGADTGGAGGSDSGAPTIDDLQAQMATLTEQNKLLTAQAETFATEKQAHADSLKKAAKDRQQQQLDASKAAGKFEEFEQQITAQFSEKETSLTSEIDRLNGVILGGKKESLVSKFAAEFVSPDVGAAMLNGMVSTAYGADGQSVLTEFKGLDGKVVSTTTDGFLDYMNKNPSLKALLRGPDSSGGMSGNGKPGTTGGEQQTITREQFDKLSNSEKMAKAKYVR